MDDYKCPICKESAVDINAGDFYECRKCHTQFCASSVFEARCDGLIDLDIGDDIILIMVMKEKGKGIFNMDKRLKQAIKEKRIALRKKRNG